MFGREAQDDRRVASVESCWHTRRLREGPKIARNAFARPDRIIETVCTRVVDSSKITSPAPTI